MKDHDHSLCHRCQEWRRGCFKAVDEVPYYSTLCPACLERCPQQIAEHYAPLKAEASS